MKKYLFLIAALFTSLSMFGQRASLNVAICKDRGLSYIGAIRKGFNIKP